MTRADVVLQIYRCIRDALTDINYTERSGNKAMTKPHISNDWVN